MTAHPPAPEPALPAELAGLSHTAVFALAAEARTRGPIRALSDTVLAELRGARLVSRGRRLTRAGHRVAGTAADWCSSPAGMVLAHEIRSRVDALLACYTAG